MPGRDSHAAGDAETGSRVGPFDDADDGGEEDVYIETDS